MKARPSVILSSDIFNTSPSERTVVVPITSHVFAPLARFRIAIDPPEGGVTMKSLIMTDHCRSVSTLRLMQKLGRLTPGTLALVEDRIRILLEL